MECVTVACANLKVSLHIPLAQQRNEVAQFLFVLRLPPP
jgi:hypothetical protein